MKRKLIFTALIAVFALVLSACGNAQETKTEAAAAPEAAAEETVTEAAETKTEAEETVTEAAETKTEAEETVTEAAETKTEAEETTADAEGTANYAVLGLQDMPKCHYLDLLCSYHYIEEYDNYVLSIVSEKKEAVDGINTFSDDGNNKAYSVDGYVLSLNETSGIYAESDIGSMANIAKKTLEDALKNGTPMNPRVFQGTGSGSIPLYADHGDDAEYEYYEYLTDTSTDRMTVKMLERFYMKDGDVFAIWTESTLGDSSVEDTKVIKSISGDIPEGTFDIPDLSGYEKY